MEDTKSLRADVVEEEEDEFVFSERIARHLFDKYCQSFDADAPDVVRRRQMFAADVGCTENSMLAIFYQFFCGGCEEMLEMIVAVEKDESVV